jgi:cellulose biosynthesis protein BcsE
VYKLNIRGLEPAAQELKTAANYAFLAPLDNLAIELALHAVGENFHNIFIVSSQIEAFFESPFSGPVIKGYEKQRVYPFSFASPVADWPAERIIKGLIKELSAYPEINNALVLMHFNTTQLEHLEDAKFTALIAKCEHLLKHSNATLLLLISGPNIAHYRFLVRQMNKLIDGSVFIENDAATRILDYDYWHHSKGVFTNRQYQLIVSEQRLVLQPPANNETQHNPNKTLDDEHDVWIVQSAVPEGTKLPASYRTVKENKDLFAKGPSFEGATLVFSVTRYTDLTQLAEQCFILRKNCGCLLKLVIQNVDGIIRHQDECLFLTLGVNLILYSYTQPSRLLSQIQSIQGFQFTRPLPPSVEHLFKYTVNKLAKGYLPFIEFTKQVEIHSDSAVNLGVSGILVELELLPRIDPIHPLHLFHIRREGDVFSIVDNTIYLYLHACRENDVRNAIEHLFKLATSDFFVQEKLITEHFYIQQKCKQLRQFYNNKKIADFSQQLAGHHDYEFEADFEDTHQQQPAQFTAVKRAKAIPIAMKART